MSGLQLHATPAPSHKAHGHGPLLRYTLCPIAFLGMAVTLFFGFALDEPGFPKWAMLAFSVGALLVYWLYLACLFSLERLVSR